MSSYAAAAKECWCKKTFLLLAQKKSYKRKGHLAGAFSLYYSNVRIKVSRSCPLTSHHVMCAGKPSSMTAYTLRNVISIIFTLTTS